MRHHGTDPVPGCVGGSMVATGKGAIQIAHLQTRRATRGGSVERARGVDSALDVLGHNDLASSSRILGGFGLRRTAEAGAVRSDLRYAGWSSSPSGTECAMTNRSRS